MSDFIKTQNSFANGAVAPEFYTRDDVNGLSRLENMDVLAGGGLSRRAGLRTLDKLSAAGRLISFSVTDDDEYLIVLTEYRMYIYHNDVLYQTITTPWAYADLSVVQYAQRFGTMIFVHPNYRPRTLCRTDKKFDLYEFTFARNDSDLTINIPFVRFDDSTDISITVTSSSSGNNYATFTTNQDFWTPDNVNGRFYLLDRQWIIWEYISPTQVIAYTNSTYTLPSTAVKDWREAAFGTRRGWPRSITFHQDRLVFGGSRDWPGGIWMSQVGRHNNFDTGTGLDDQAIFISLLSERRQQICTVVSSDNLQILTSVGEWAISSKPLTPSSVDIKQHTSVGSYSARYLAPQKIEGATIFVARSGRDIRELSLDELGEHYNATDLCALSKHLMGEPVDIAYNDALHRLYIVCSDGNMAVLNHNATLGISAWGTYLTQGNFLSVAVSGGHTYVIVRRGGNIYLERFDSDVMIDGASYGFSFVASGLPLRISNHNASRIKIRKIVARVLDTKSIFINSQRATLPNSIYTTDDTAGFSGDISINLLGTIRDGLSPIWTIHGSEPYPTTVLSVCTHGWYSV